jgi:hypothetical protein
MPKYWPVMTTQQKTVTCIAGLGISALWLLAVACQRENSITINVRPAYNPFAGTDFASLKRQVSKTDPPYELEVELELAKTESRYGYRNFWLHGIFKNNSGQAYKTVYLIVYMYDWQDAILGKVWVPLNSVAPGDKMRVDYQVDQEYRSARAELKQVKLIW